MSPYLYPSKKDVGAYLRRWLGWAGTIILTIALSGCGAERFGSMPVIPGTGLYYKWTCPPGYYAGHNKAGSCYKAPSPPADSDLFEAARMGYTARVNALLNNGTDVNAKSKDGKTALGEASRLDRTETVRVLLDRGADVNATNEDGDTALKVALWLGHTETVRVLLDKGADVNAKDKNGDTALMEASRRGHTETIRVLLDRGADVNATNNNGWTALRSASWWASHQKTSRKDYAEIVQLLKKAGAKE